MGVSVDVECTAAAVAVVVVVVVVADERRRQRIERLQCGVVERVVEMRIGDGGGEWRKRVALGGRGAGGVVVGQRVGEQERGGGGVVVDVTADRQRRCNEPHQPPRARSAEHLTTISRLRQLSAFFSDLDVPLFYIVLM